MLRIDDATRSPQDFWACDQAEFASPQTLARATWAFLLFGILIRLIRLGLAHPLWGDECSVVANLLKRDYLGLLKPLDYQQVCPPLFLWLELASLRVFGLSEWSVRLVPTFAAVLSLFLCRHVASRLVRGLPLLLVVAILAVSINPIRHGGEAKPYATDFLVALSLIAIAIEWWRRPERSRWLWVLACFVPLALGLSLPSVFMMGGIGLSLARPVIKGRRTGVIAALVVANLVAVASFGVLLALRLGVQADELREYMLYYWSDQFPPREISPGLLLWLVQAHTGDLFSYPVGGSRGASVLTTLCVGAGSVDLWRRGRGLIVVMLFAPLGVALVASLFQVYPYGESERLMQFAGPMACLLAGVGLARWIGCCRRPGGPRRVMVAALGTFVAIGLGILVVDLIQPSRTVADLRARDFARSFWREVADGAEVACERTDLQLDLEVEKEPNHHGRSANYLCYQRIESARHRQGLPLDWRKIAPERPLRCVFFDGVPADSSRFDAWMAAMNSAYRLVRTRTYRGNPGLAPKGVSCEDHLAVLEFVPIGEPVDPLALARRARGGATKASRGDGRAVLSR